MRAPRILAIVAVVSLGAGSAATVPAADAATDDPWAARRALNVAHAGGDLEAPHSTLYAMKTAVAAGTDVLEMDVRLSADGVLMVHHDETLDRTTEATGPMRDRTAAQLQALDNAYWFVPDCWSCHDRPESEYQLRGIRTGSRPAPAGFAPDDFAIPTLEQVATTFPARLLDVEIKDGPDGMAAAEALAAFIAAHGPADRYLVASFDDAILAHFKTFAPDVATSPGLGEMVQWFGTRDAMPHHRVLQVPPVYSGIEVVTQQFVDDAHADGLAVWVWFNGTDDDQADEWNRLLDLGVDALLTGRPAAAQATLDARDAAFTAAPHLGETWTMHPRRVHGTYACPAVHVARCRSLLVLVTIDGKGREHLAGLGVVGARRGTERAVAIARVPARGRAVRAMLIAFPIGDDTATVGGPVTIQRI